MPIYEYYCPDNHKIYQFFAKTLAQGQTVPRCPDNPAYRMEKIVSAFAVGSGAKKSATEPPAGGSGGEGGTGGGATPEDARMEAAMGAMEQEFAHIDENDPRAMGRMMRRMAELSGEKIDGEMEEVVRKLEEGTDPDKLEEQFGEAGGPGEGGEDPYGEMGGMGGGAPAAPQPDPKEPRAKYKVRRGPPQRDPHLYDYS